MDFIHCNACGSYPFGIQRRYFLSSCGHLICDICSRKIADCCIVCEAKCNLVEINAQSSQEVKLYFMDGTDIFKDSFKRIVQVTQFQRQHVKSLGAHYKNKVAAYESLRSEHEGLKGQYEMLKRDNMELAKKIEALEQREQSRIGGSIQNPLELGLEIFSDQNKGSFPFLNNGSSPVCMNTPMVTVNFSNEDIRRSGSGGRDFGAVGSGRPSNGQRPHFGHTPSSLYLSSPSLMNSNSSANRYQSRGRQNATSLPYVSHQRLPSISPSYLTNCPRYLQDSVLATRTPSRSCNSFESSGEILDRLQNFNW